MEYKPNDVVFLSDSVREDIGMLAWGYVQNHRRATVLDVLEYPEGLEDDRKQYAVQFTDEFQGGHNCWGVSQPRKGQFVMAKHLSLAFEDSNKEVQTVPNIEADRLDSRISQVLWNEAHHGDSHL